MLDQRMAGFSAVFSSNLLEAELRAALRREGLAFDPAMLARVEWVWPEQPLTSELASVLDAGYLKGADAWHLANALHVAGDARDMTFLTLDRRQREVAADLGFQT